MPLTYEAYEAVKAFHVKNNLTTYNGHGVVGPDVRLLRARLILEELGEVAVAVHNNDLVEVADGFADLLYVTYGTAVSMTGPVPDYFLRGVPGCLVNPRTRLIALNQLTHWAQRVVARLESDTLTQADLGRLCQVICYGSQDPYNLPFEQVFFEVCRSNMTKELGKTDGGAKGDQGPNYKGPGYEPPNLLQFISPGR
jgi:predicted HAD superfamily Cof-like phosphohydrolase